MRMPFLSGGGSHLFPSFVINMITYPAPVVKEIRISALPGPFTPEAMPQMSKGVLERGATIIGTFAKCACILNPTRLQDW